MLPAETATQRKSAGSSYPGGHPSLDDVESLLVGWWQELLGLEPVELDNDFFELGGHSLIGVQLFNRIKKTYRVNLVLSTLFEARTVRQLAQRIREEHKMNHAEPKSGSPIIPIQPEGSQPPLFWIPGGYGTTVLPFREVSLLLGSDQPVYGFEAKMPAPDQELESIPDRAARFVKEMRSVQPNGPYSLVGWCGGGYIAFEMAQQLSKEGQVVDYLAIVDCVVPRYPRSWAGKIRFFAERTIWLARNLLRRGPKGMLRWALVRCKSFARAMLLSSGRAGAQLLERPIPALPRRIDETDERVWRNVDRYEPVSYCGKCVVIVGNDSRTYGGLSSSVDPRLAWCKLSEGGSEIRTVPGDHEEMLKAPNSYQFAQELKFSLERSRASSS